MLKCKAVLRTVAILFASLLLLSFAPSPLLAGAEQEEYNKGYILKRTVPEYTRERYDIRLPAIHIRFPNEFIPFFNFDAYGTYSNANTGSDVWGASVSGSVSPVAKYSDSLYFIPLYDGSYSKEKLFAYTEEGARAYDEFQHHDLSLMAKYLATDRATISPYIFGGWDLNVETDDEDWGDGLYDYEEFGSGVDFDYLVFDTQRSQVVLNSGFKWYIRNYPNYKALIALATTTAPEEDEKDFNAFEFQAGWQYSNLRTFSLECGYSSLMKFFTDKKIIDADGVLEDDEREEYRNSLRLKASYTPVPGRGFQYNCLSEFVYNTSNQNFYDSRGTTSLADDVFTPDYFDYLSIEVHPRVSYIVKDGDKTTAVIEAGYDFLVRDYTDRKAQMKNGTFTSKEQRDYQHVFTGTLEIPFDEHLSWVTKYDYIINDSNMDYEQYYEYSYTMHRVLSGISLSY